MNKTQFKNKMVENGFKCLKFKNEMIFAKSNLIFNINQYGVYVFDEITLYDDIICNNKSYLTIFNTIINFYNNYVDFE